MTIGSSDVFVGRSGDLGALERALEAARGGRAQVVLVEGEAGIGKTTLVRRFLAGADLGVVLRATGEEDEIGLVFGVVAQLVATAGGLASEMLGALSLTADPLVVGSGLLETLAVLQAHGTVGVVVDDLHWADLPSARALAFACRRLAADRVLVVVTVRPEELERLGERWARLASAEHAVHVRLGGLVPAELVALARALGEALDGPAARRLWEHTGGHPLYARSLLGELGPGALGRAAGPLPAPRSLAATVLGRLSRCSPETESLIAAASVLGPRAAVQTVVSLGDAAQGPAALDEAVRAQFLRELPGSVGRELEFVHPLVRAAVYEDLGPARRRRLHARAGELLGGTAALPHRLAAAIGPDADLASDLEATATAEAARGALTEAGRHLLEAASVSAPGPDQERRVLSGLEAHLAVGDVGSAEAAAGMLDALPPSARRACVAGTVALLRGRALEAKGLLLEAWALLAPAGGPPALATAIAAQLSTLMVVAQDFEGIARWGEEAWRAGANEPAVAGLALWAYGCLSVVGRGEEPRVALDALGPADAVGTALLDGLVGRGILRMWTDDLAGARADLQTVLARAQAGEPLRFIGTATGYLGEVCYRAGELDQAVVYGELALTMAAAAGREFDLPFAHAMAAYPRAARGELAEARAHVQAALSGARSFGVAGAFQVAGAAAAVLAQAEDDASGLVRAAGLHRDAPELGIFPIGPIQAEALLISDRLDEADAVLSAYEQQAAGMGRRSVQVHAARIRVVLEAARGELDAARAAFDSGLAHAAGLGRPLELGRLQLAFGDALVRFKQRRETRSVLTEAAAIFASIGARQYLARAQRRLEAIGGPRGRMAPEGGLSAQESAVAGLVASGLTNKQFAARLFVSAKTVEYHLANVYDKLGLSSRTQLAARLGGGQRAQPTPAGQPVPNSVRPSPAED